MPRPAFLPKGNDRKPVRVPCACEFDTLSALAVIRRAIAEGESLGYGSHLLDKLRDAQRSMLSALADLA